MLAIRDPRTELASFLGFTFCLSALWYWLIIQGGGLDSSGWYVFALMWTPAIGAILTRLGFHRTMSGLGWRLPAPRWAVLGYLLPVAYGSVAYGAVWLLGLGAADLSRAPANLLVFLVLGNLEALLTAFGEELGWRGYLVPELAKTRSLGRVALISGSIWAAWHMPLIVFSDYNHAGTNTAYAMICFTISVIALSVPMAWLRLRSQSVWPAALLHASHNLYIQGFFDKVTVDTGYTHWFTSECGVALAITISLSAWPFWKARTAGASS